MPLRYPVAALAGLLVAAFLLWLMQLLVTPRQQPPASSDSPGLIEFVRLKREERIQTRERRSPPPPPTAQPLPRPQLDLDDTIEPLAPKLEMHANLKLPLQLGRGPSLAPPATRLDRDFMPLSRPPPQYPYQAARRGIEGWVRVSFRVTETGTVADVEVVDSDPPGVFDQAALNAVYRWRFKPRLVNGRAVAGLAEQVVEFKLDE